MALKSSIPLTALAVSKVFLKEVLRSLPEVLTARGEGVRREIWVRRYQFQSEGVVSSTWFFPFL